MIFPREIWKDIKDYEGLYQVSNLGRVRSLKYRHAENKIKLLKQGSRSGYKTAHLSKNNQSKTYYIHRLVATAFIFNSNVNKYTEVNHKDEDKTNNCVWNLEWCNRKYNMNYGTIKKRISKYLTNNNEISKTVYQYDLYGNLVKEYPSANEVQRQLNYSQSNISSCCNGKIKLAYGYVWSYKELTKEEIKKKLCGAKINNKEILQFDLNDNFIKEYINVSEIKNELNIKCKDEIIRCCNGKRNNAYGFKWKYKESINEQDSI